MGKKRLINCEFINASDFKVKLSNKAKLLYLFMFVSADDKGFVDTTTEIIETLTNCDQNFNNDVSLELLQNDYNTALTELMNRGLLYCFEGKHNNRVYVIRHWYMHNINLQKAWTNYPNYLKQLKLEDYKYIRKKEYKEYKENNRNNITDDSLSKQESEDSDKSWDDLYNDIERARPKGENNGN